MRRKGSSLFFENRLKQQFPIGAVYGRLTVIGYKHRGDGEGSWSVNCRCSCGRKKEIKRPGFMQDGRVSSCGCLKKESMRQNMKSANSSRKYPTGEYVLTAVWRAYQQSARKRKIDFNLSKQKFSELVKLPCRYCGRLPFTTLKIKGRDGGFTYNGIDRINSSKGYVEGNMVPACKICNRAKRDMTVDEFFAWLKLVTIHLFDVTY